jgi:hypothetical protein
VKRTLRLALIMSVLGFAGGCVSLTPAQKSTVADVQGFADATAAAYRMMRIPVTVQAPTNLGIGGVYRQGNFFLNVNALDSGHLTALVAHELGHYVLGHEPTSGVSMAELLKAQEVRELDANANRPHGTLTGDVTPPAWNGYLLTVACPYGVVFQRWVTPEDAELDLLRAASLN